MSHNPQPANTPWFALPGHRVIALEGRDAIVFAQSQCMNDVEAAPPGRWQWNGWLTPKGRVIALFALVRITQESVWLIVPDADVHILAEQLQRFVLRRQLQVTVRGDLHAAGRFESPENAAGASFAGTPEDGIELDFNGFGLRRTLRIAPGHPAPIDEEAEMRWRASDLRLGFPRLPASQAEQWTPQMLSLDRLHAFSVKKGCYPGQEIVARTHFLGQVKRGLTMFECPDEPEVGANVDVGAAPLGQIVSAARNGEGWIALAVLPVDRPEAQVATQGMALRERALLAGLAR
jgi:folate-binding protein YgfZ